jgi:hypothetical protein
VTYPPVKRKATQLTRGNGGGEGRGSDPEDPTSPDLVILAILALVGLLMAFSIIWWMVGSKEAAAVAGVGASGLAVHVVRRSLKSIGRPKAPRSRSGTR